MIKKILVVLSVTFMSFVALAKSNIDREIDKTLNEFHHSAAQADMHSYFNLLTKDAVFLGTDGKERWTKAEFKAFVEPYFSKGQGWLYSPKERNLTKTAMADVVIFDEILENEHYGECRGSGVVIKTKAGWKIAQYNLSIPIPNLIAKEVVQDIKKHKTGY